MKDVTNWVFIALIRASSSARRVARREDELPDPVLEGVLVEEEPP